MFITYDIIKPYLASQLYMDWVCGGHNRLTLALREIHSEGKKLQSIMNG